MKKPRYSPEQVGFCLHQVEERTPVSEVCRKMGISEQTFCRWKRKFQGMGAAEVRRLRILEEENRKLKQLVADLSLDKQMLQDMLRKNLKPAQLRPTVDYLQVAYRVSERRACGVLALSRGSHRYRMWRMSRRCCGCVSRTLPRPGSTTATGASTSCCMRAWPSRWRPASVDRASWRSCTG